VSEIIAFDNFANLEEFYIRETGYGALTMEAVNMLIEGCPQLKIIEGLRTCPHLNPVFIRELRRKLLADNLDIQIIW
jgi:hypothetical protein